MFIGYANCVWLLNKLDLWTHSWKGTHSYLGNLLCYIPVSPWNFPVLPTHESFHSSKLNTSFFSKVSHNKKKNQRMYIWISSIISPHYDQKSLQWLWSKGNWQERLNSCLACNSDSPIFLPKNLFYSNLPWFPEK